MINRQRSEKDRLWEKSGAPDRVHGPQFLVRNLLLGSYFVNNWSRSNTVALIGPQHWHHRNRETGGAFTLLLRWWDCGQLTSEHEWWQRPPPLKRNLLLLQRAATFGAIGHMEEWKAAYDLSVPTFGRNDGDTFTQKMTSDVCSFIHACLRLTVNRHFLLARFLWRRQWNTFYDLERFSFSFCHWSFALCKMAQLLVYATIMVVFMTGLCALWSWWCLLKSDIYNVQQLWTIY